MQGADSARHIARWIALGALFLIPLMPLVVVNTFFFPFISGKGFYFRVLVEIVVFAWGALAFLDRAYRPRFSWAGVAVVAFVGWMFVANLFAVNVEKAFWSNFERMEGWVLLIHLLGFFFAASNVLRAEKKWRAWFLTSLSVSFVVSVYAFLQFPIWTVCDPNTNVCLPNSSFFQIHQGSTRIDATFGNSAYFAIYLLFSMCVALWLALTEKYISLKYALIALASAQGILIFFTETRGTVIGLIVALALGALLTALTAKKSARLYAGGAFVAIVVLASGLYFARHSAFVQNNSTLQRVTSVSLADGQTRFTLWHMAWLGALERPIVGWGQEGYNYVFNKYYEPSLYHQEQWFDRAHSTFIDWLVAGGFPAFLLYGTLFGVAIVLLWTNSVLSRPERIALTAALVGYAIHNFFVFDNLYSYVYFFAILALIDSQVGKPVAKVDALPEVDDVDGVTYVLPISVVLIFASIWFVNVPGIRVAHGLINALSAPQLDARFVAFEELIVHPAFAAQEIREQLVSLAVNVAADPQITDDQKKNIATLALNEMQKQIAAYPMDTREYLQLAQVYRAYGDVPEAFKEMQTALTFSPRKISLLLMTGMMAWDAGDAKAADSYFSTAYALAPQFPDLAEYVAAGQLAIGNVAAADALLQKTFGTTTVNSDVLASAYYRSKNWTRLIALWKARTQLPDANARTWFSLGAVYYAAGDSDTAIRILRKTAVDFPDAASSVETAIGQIQSGVGK